MSKRYNIRWRAEDSAALQRAVKNFNAKITRLEKKDPRRASALPDRVTMKEMRDLISTRQDLNREINALKRFSAKGAETLVKAPGNEYNVKITKWQKEEMTRRIGQINRKRAKRLEEIQKTEVQSGRKDVGYTRGQIGMGKAEQISLEPMKPFTPKMSRTDIKKKFINIRKESQTTYWRKKDLQLKENYIKSLQQNFRKADIKDLIDKISDMDVNAFMSVFNSEGDLLEFSYPPSEEEYQGNLNHIKAVWIPSRKG